MKRLSTLLVAAMAALVLASCASTGAASSSSAAPAPAAPKVEEPKLPEGAVAYWDFKKKPGSGRITSDYATFSADVPLPPMAGSAGATLTLKEGSEAKYLSEPDPFLTTNNKSSTTLDNITSAYKAVLELTLETESTVDFVVAGNGDASMSRIVAIADATGTVLGSKNNMGKEPFETFSVKCAAGTYNIYMNGSRLHELKISK